jgi:hypothetical protein
MQPPIFPFATRFVRHVFVVVTSESKWCSTLRAPDSLTRAALPQRTAPLKVKGRFGAKGSVRCLLPSYEGVRGCDRRMSGLSRRVRRALECNEWNDE